VVAIDHRSQRQAGERFSHARVAMAEDGDDLADAALEQSLRDSPDRGLAADFQEELVAIAHSLRSTAASRIAMILPGPDGASKSLVAIKG